LIVDESYNIIAQFVNRLFNDGFFDA
jgi:hypothetical protein